MSKAAPLHKPNAYEAIDALIRIREAYGLPDSATAKDVADEAIAMKQDRDRMIYEADQDGVENDLLT